MGLKVASRKGIQRKDIYNKYMSTIENQTLEMPVKVEYAHQPCKGCGKKYQVIHDDTTSEDVCMNCGCSEYILGEELGFKEEQEMDKNVVYSYKRDNHFNEWISQFQAKESTSVPDEVITQLQNEFKKQKIKELLETGRFYKLLNLAVNSE
jgi:transposase